MFKIIQKLRASIPVLCAAAAAAAIFTASRQACAAGRDTKMLPGTVSNFELPNFDENSGIKEWELFGDKATYISDEHIDIDNMKLNLFEGKETPVLKAVMTSPNAQVNAPKKAVTSLDKIFVKGDAFDLSGKKWKWDGDKKFIEIFSNVKIALISKSPPDIDVVAGLPTDSASPEQSSKPAISTPEKPTGKGLPENSVTNISSDYASLDHGGKANKFNVKNNVVVKNADMSLECDELEVDSLKSGEEKIGEIRARGNVRMSTDLRKASANALSIFPSKNEAVLSGNPEIEDISSKSKISGDKIILNRSEKSIISLPSADGKIRPKTLLFDAKDGKVQEISIQADDIKMRTEDKKSFFDFKGNVKVSSDDFSARCDSMTAMAAPEADGKTKIVKIEGSGNVKVETPSGTAKSKELEITPAKSEILLHDNVVLTDAKRGFNLKSNTLVFASGRDEGVALSDGKDKNSYVITTITETPSVERAASPSKKAAPTIIKSRILSFSRDSEGIANLHFQKDVSIKSEEIEASCQKMDVVAKSNKGKTDIYKIVASKDVSVSQKGNTATAQLANIYPRVNGDKSSKEPNKSGKVHRFVELLTDEKSPEIRPAIILPALGNIGLNDEYSAEKAKSEPTVITSDKQWLTSSLDADKYYFKGNVKVSGTDMNASCQNIEVTIKTQPKDNKREITHIAMTENVKLSQGLKDAACGRADIYAKEEMVVLSNSPVVRNREDNTRATGFRIIYNRGKQSATIEAENSGQMQEDNGQSDAPARPTVTLPPIGSFDGK